MQFLGDSRWELVRCACGQVFHGLILDDEWSEIRFSQWMGGDAIREFERQAGHAAFDARFRAWRSSTEHLVALERLAPGTRPGAPPRLLDFGCGWGDFVAAASAAGFQAVGLDRDPHRRAGTAVFPDFASLDAAGVGPFHALTAFQVLEHVPEPLEVLRELRARALPGAILVLETPDASGAAGLRTMHEYRTLHPLDHIQGFTPATLRAIGRRAGWAPIHPPVAHVTASTPRVLRRVAGGVLHRVRPTMSAYFRAG